VRGPTSDRDRAVAIYLASVVTSGPAIFIAYWIVALVLILQAGPLLRRRAVIST